MTSIPEDELTNQAKNQLHRSTNKPKDLPTSSLGPTHNKVSFCDTRSQPLPTTPNDFETTFLAKLCIDDEQTNHTHHPHFIPISSTEKTAYIIIDIIL